MNTPANLFPTGIFVHETRPIWTLQFNADGTYVFRVNGVLDASGTYSIDGDRYTEDTDYLPCRDARIASYTYAYESGRLVFHLVGEDNCAERRASLNGVTWIRQERAAS
jgi:hypothetical protein